MNPKSKDDSKSQAANKVGAGVICILLVALVWIVFGQTLQHDFVNYDDADYVYQNPIIRNGLSIQGIQWAFTHVHSSNWHPLTTLSHMLDVQLFGLKPWGHHLTNVVFHAAAAIFLFLALRQLTGAQWPSAFVAAVFAIHPLHVSSVAWIAERKDVLSGLFFMLTLLAYGWYARGNRSTSRAYIAAILFFALGLMCKPTLVTVPFVLLLLDYWPLGRIRVKAGASELPAGRSLGRLITEKIPFFLLSAASCVATLLAQQTAVVSNRPLPLGARIGNAIVSYVAYIGQSFWPVDLAAVYPFPSRGVSSEAVIFSLLILVIISANVFIWRRPFPFLLVGWLWFVGVLVPMIGIVQVGNQARADRYTYLAQIGLCVLVTWSAVELSKKWRPANKVMVALALLIVTALTTDSHYQTAAWQNSETLWTRALAATQNNYIAHNNLGGALRKKGQIDDAIVHYRKALEICTTTCPEVLNSLGHAFSEKGNWAEATGWYERAVQSWPVPDSRNNNNLGIALAQTGRPEEAIEQFREALRLDPDFVDAHYNLAMLLKQLGRTQDAKSQFEEVLRLVPNEQRVKEQLSQLEAGK